MPSRILGPLLGDTSIGEGSIQEVKALCKGQDIIPFLSVTNIPYTWAQRSAIT